MSNLVNLPVLMHFDTDIASIFITHVALRAVEVVLYCNSVTDLKVCQLSNLYHMANGFMTRHKGNTVTVVQRVLICF